MNYIYLEWNNNWHFNNRTKFAFSILVCVVIIQGVYGLYQGMSISHMQSSFLELKLPLNSKGPPVQGEATCHEVNDLNLILSSKNGRDLPHSG